jgi:hypothetical protein
MLVSSRMSPGTVPGPIQPYLGIGVRLDGIARRSVNRSGASKKPGCKCVFSFLFLTSASFWSSLYHRHCYASAIVAAVYVSSQDMNNRRSGIGFTRLSAAEHVLVVAGAGVCWSWRLPSRSRIPRHVSAIQIPGFWIVSVINPMINRRLLRCCAWASGSFHHGACSRAWNVDSHCPRHVACFHPRRVSS